jgi:hypothetical protein
VQPFLESRHTITYTQCVLLALCIPHLMRMLLIILAPMACLAVPHFSMFYKKLHDFQRKIY